MLRFVLRLKKLHLFLFLLMASLSAMAQRTVNGKVISSENKQPLPGATVVVKGRTTTVVYGTRVGSFDEFMPMA